MTYQSFILATENHVAHIKINRPEKANALHQSAWLELKEIIEFLDGDPETRVIILSGEGKHFCSGIDLSLLQNLTENTSEQCAARTSEKLRKQILALQAPINAIENCRKPVIAAISGGCIGAGLDIVTACDMRYASSNAYFSIREIDMSMVADLGTLQRLPKLIAPGIVREMAYTCRNVDSAEAEKIGLVNKSYSSKEEMMSMVYEVAKVIAAKSPVAVRGTKHILNHSRDHTVSDGLDYVATWNSAKLLSSDLHETFQSKIEGRDPTFPN